MRARAKAQNTPALLEAAGRVAAWRAKRRAGSAMPEALWSEAVELARECGLYPTAQALHLDYGKLKKLAGGGGKKRGKSAALAFVDVGSAEEIRRLAAGTGGSGVTEIEVELTSGDRVRVRTTGSPQIDLAGLVRQLRSGQ